MMMVRQVHVEECIVPASDAWYISSAGIRAVVSFGPWSGTAERRIWNGDRDKAVQQAIDAASKLMLTARKLEHGWQG